MSQDDSVRAAIASAREAELAHLRQQYTGRNISELPTPSLVLDKRIVASHCQQMLEACRGLGVGFRAHVKTHKVLEPTVMELQEG